ncbi:MAG: hypothetical protein HOV68_33575 [Streptomycetaceae bacterium]|nr:hypothetical protein [Streptomycetaceae bacterium]
MIVAARFNGPPASGNGGYTAGLLAAELGPGPATVTLRKPPPLETPLEVIPAGDGLELRQADEVVATAVAAASAPQSPAWADPTGAGPYAGFADHPFPTCYVCGPERGTDALRIFPGVLPDGRTAARWTVPSDVSAVTVWAALDCPGGWAIIAPGRPYVLGRITVAVQAVPSPGEECVVIGEFVRSEGRKGFVRTGLFGADRQPLAAAEAVWIAI